MRSVIVHLDGTSEDEVHAHLDGKYERQGGAEWTLRVHGDPCLYISFYRDIETEFEPDELAEMKARFKHWPPISVVADVSGRHDGGSEVRQFVAALLGRWRGVVTDEDGLLEDAS